MSSNYESIKKNDRIFNKIPITKQKTLIFVSDIFLFLCGIILARGKLAYYLMPFSFSYFGYILKYNRKKTWLSISLIIGLFSIGSFAIIPRYAITYVIIFIINKKFEALLDKTWKQALSISLSVIFVGLVYNLFGNHYLFDIALVILEGLLSFSLYYIYSSALSTLLLNNRTRYSNQEIICTGIFISFLILGINNIYIYNYSLQNIFGIMIILLASYKFGIGASAPIGILFGLILNISGQGDPYILGVFSICSLIAGSFKEAGKFFVILGFIVSNAMMAFYLNGSTEVFIHIEEILIGALPLILIPNSVWNALSMFDDERKAQDYQLFYKDRLNEGIKEKLSYYSLMFKYMGASFTGEESYMNDEDMYSLFTKMSIELCNNCYLYSRCWKTDVQNTYMLLMNALESLEDEEHYSKEAIEQLKNKCIKEQELIKELNYILEIYKKEKSLKQRINDNKVLISQQLLNTSDIISNMKDNLDRKSIYKNTEEGDIIIELDKNNIKVDKLFVSQELNSRYKIIIVSKNCFSDDMCKKNIPEIISKVLNVKMVLDNRICMYGSNYNEECKITYKEMAPFRITTGIKRYCKEKNEQSGDIFSDKLLDNGKRVLALCDGMGIGNKAAMESNTAINLLEQFLNADIDKVTTIKTINSILMLRKDREVFSTLDYIVFDQYTGEAEINKIGAAITLIKQDEEVKIIRGQSLPVGILKEIKIESAKININEGDLVVMMTDGIFECYDNPEKVELWVINQLKKNKSRNPQKIAEDIFEKFTSTYDLPNDDLTILVGKVWKKR